MCAPQLHVSKLRLKVLTEYVGAMVSRSDIVRAKKIIGWVDVEQVGTTRYVVTTHSGYRAEIPMCVHDAYVGRREVCLKEVGSYARCNKGGHCHRGHREHVDAFVVKLMNTYMGTR